MDREHTPAPGLDISSQEADTVDKGKSVTPPVISPGSQVDIYSRLSTYLVPPRSMDETESGNAVRMLTVVLRSSGDKMRDVLRLRRIHGMISSYPGDDRFAVHVYERGHGYLLEFPNYTCGATRELIERLTGMLGVDNVKVETITFQ
jgi:hypothetical protein